LATDVILKFRDQIQSLLENVVRMMYGSAPLVEVEISQNVAET
jgi:hypothetical protein